MFVHEGSPRPVCDDDIPNSLERYNVSPMYSQPSFSPEIDFDMPIDNFEICDYNVDWEIRITCLMRLVGMLTFLCP